MARGQRNGKKPAVKAQTWKALEAHHKKVSKPHLRELFAEDPERGERMAVEAVGLYLDYSKNRVTDETLELLLQLAEEAGLQARIDAMFRGEKINLTENRAVLHTALRAPKGSSIVVDGENVVPKVQSALDKMADFADRVRSGAWKGHTGKPIRNVINIGIGGSDLGPVMAYEALKAYSERALTFRFVSNIDGADFAEAARDLDPIFATLAPGVGEIPRTPGRENSEGTAEWGYLHCGPGGAGHFVKMVHNGIEYGIMAAYAEGLGVLRSANVGKRQQGIDAETTPLRDPERYQYDLDLSDITEVWRRGSVIASWLLDLTAAALHDDPDLSRFAGRVSDSGEGRWTIKAAIDEAAPAPVLTAALYERFESRGEAEFVDKILSAMRYQFGGHLEKTPEKS